MGIPFQKYLFMDKRSKCSSILDVNSNNEAGSIQYPILYFRDVENIFFSFPSNEYKSLFAYYHQVSVKKNANYRTAYPMANTALVFRCTHNKPEAFFLGTPTHPFEMKYIIPGNDYFVVLLRPGIGYTFCPFPLIELTNQYIPLDDILPLKSEEITERVALSKSYLERVRVFEEFMQRQIPRLREIPNQIYSIFMTILYHSPDCPSIQRLIREINYTDRHIRRLFLKYFGVTPKLLASIVRYQKILRSLNIICDQNMAGLAFDHGYCDQSHFIKEFKRFQGITPNQFISDFLQKDKGKV